MAFNDTEPHKKAPVPQILFCETGALFMLWIKNFYSARVL